MSRSMVRSFVFSLVFIFVLAVTILNTGCVGVTAAAPAGSAQSTQTAVSISISPQTVSLSAGGSQQFTATVSGTSNTAVNWAASGGSIIGTGDGVVYTAPTTAGTYTVIATSVADTTQTATATVTVSASSSVVGVAITP